MFINKTYKAYPAQETRDGFLENHRMNVRVDVGFRNDGNIRKPALEALTFEGQGKTKKDAFENLMFYLNEAKKDIETAVKEAKTI